MAATEPSPAAYAQAGRAALEAQRALAARRAAAPWIHDTCPDPDCGFDGDVPIIVDSDEGVQGWECPDCFTFVVTRDLADA